MTSDIKKILEEYFLSFDSNIKNKIISESSESTRGIITQIENAFLLGIPTNELISTTRSAENTEFFTALRLEYYFSLLELDSDTETSNNSTRKTEYNKIINSSNQLFARIEKEWLEIGEFENELPIIFQNIERNALKRELLKLEELESFEISDNELEQALTQLERAEVKKRLNEIDEYEIAGNNVKEIKLTRKVFIRIAAAASILGFLLTGVYLVMLKKPNDSLLSKSKNVTPDKINNLMSEYKMPNFTNSRKYLIEPNSIDDEERGFSAPHKNHTTVSIIVCGVGQQIDTLKSLQKRIRNNTIKLNDSIKNRIDSDIIELNNRLGSYRYDDKRNLLEIYLRSIDVKVSLIMLNLNSKKQLFAKIENDYFLINPSTNYIKLRKVISTDLLEELKLVESLNDI